MVVDRGRADLLAFKEADWMSALQWTLTKENPLERVLGSTPIEVVKVVSFVERVLAPNTMPCF